MAKQLCACIALIEDHSSVLRNHVRQLTTTWIGCLWCLRH